MSRRKRTRSGEMDADCGTARTVAEGWGQRPRTAARSIRVPEPEPQFPCL